jgi:gluconate kinase
MKAEMLKSQFEILEEPVEAITVDVEADIESMIDTIIKAGVF